MSKNIKEAVEEFKKQNGNNNFKNSDLLMYIVHRLDRLPCKEHLGEIKEANATVRSWKWVAGILITITYSILLGILWVLLNYISK